MPPHRRTSQQVNKAAGEAILKGVIGAYFSSSSHWLPTYQQLTFLQFYQTVSILRLSYTIRHTVSWEYVIQITEPAEKVSETVKSAVGGATAQASQKAEELKHDAKGAANEAGYNADSLSAQASQKAGELKEDVKGSATNAGHTAEQVKLEAQKKANNRKHSIQARFGMFTSTSTVIEC